MTNQTSTKTFTEQFQAYRGDGDSWGTFEFYDDFAALLDAALRSDEDFDTGFMGVKKEIMSFRVVRTAGNATCYVSCSDDFDTDGNGSVTVELSSDPAARIAQIRAALSEALINADEDKEQNEAYAGFSVGATSDNGEPKWEYTLVLPRGIGGEWDSPPGDNYHWWGWEDVVPEDEIASFGDEAEVRADNANALEALQQADRDAFEKWAWEWIYADDNAKPEPLTLNGNSIRPWK